MAFHTHTHTPRGVVVAPPPLVPLSLTPPIGSTSLPPSRNARTLPHRFPNTQANVWRVVDTPSPVAMKEVLELCAAKGDLRAAQET